MEQNGTSTARVALFLDVDRTLTLDLIQRTFARELNCTAEYEEIEREYQAGDVDRQASREFGENIVTLFRERQFSEVMAAQMFHKIRLREGAESLLSLKNVDKFLVSSGPSYYIRILADKFGIPPANVRCSQYDFEKGLISGCSYPIFNTEKRDFVDEKKRNYSVTIGVGDSVKEDRDFVTQCTVPILFNGDDPDCARVSSLGTVARLARQLSQILATTNGRVGTGEPFTSEIKGLTIVQLWERVNEQTAEGKLSVGQLAQGLSLNQILRVFDWSVWVAFISTLILVGSATLGVDHWIMDLLIRAGKTH
jgi:phosphoserine phosphatase